MSIEISHAIPVKVSDPMNLAVNIGEKVCKEVSLNFKMKLISTSWIILYMNPLTMDSVENVYRYIATLCHVTLKLIHAGELLY